MRHYQDEPLPDGMPLCDDAGFCWWCSQHLSIDGCKCPTTFSPETGPSGSGAEGYNKEKEGTEPMKLLIGPGVALLAALAINYALPKAPPLPVRALPDITADTQVEIITAHGVVTR